MINPMLSDIFTGCGFEPVLKEYTDSRFIQLRQDEPNVGEFKINLCCNTVGETIDKLKEMYNDSDNEDSGFSSEWRKEKLKELVERMTQLETNVDFRVSPVYVSEIDFDKIFSMFPDFICLEDNEGIDPYFDDSERTIDWEFNTYRQLSESIVERSGYEPLEIKDAFNDEYIDGLNPLNYDDVYPEFYLIINENKRIFIETAVKINEVDLCTCGRTVFSDKESKVFYKYLDNYIKKFNGKTINEYLLELKKYSDNMNNNNSAP